MSALDVSASPVRVRHVGALTTLAGAALAYFAAALVALHALRPDLDPLGLTTSHYANGRYGFLMAAAFLAMGLATAALVAGLGRGAPPRVRSPLGLALLGWWAVAVLVAMVFPIDPPGAAESTAGTVHRVNGPIGFIAATAGVLLQTARFPRDARWRGLFPATAALALLMTAGFIGFGASRARQLGLDGLAQRVALVALLAWMAVVAARLHAAARAPGD